MAESNCKLGLRTFRAVHIDEDLTHLKGKHENALFHNCTFDNLNGVTLERCVLDRSRFITSDPLKALNFTLTLNCHSFRNVEYSEELFDLMLVLLTMSKGNVEKRKKLIEVVGRENFIKILSKLRTMETT